MIQRLRKGDAQSLQNDHSRGERNVRISEPVDEVRPTRECPIDMVEAFCDLEMKRLDLVGAETSPAFLMDENILCRPQKIVVAEILPLTNLAAPGRAK